MLQPLKINLKNSEGNVYTMNFDIKEEEPHLFTLYGDPVEMVLEDDAIKFNIRHLHNIEEFRSISLTNKTPKEQYNTLNDIIKLRIKTLKEIRKYEERKKEKELKMRRYEAFRIGGIQ